MTTLYRAVKGKSALITEKYHKTVEFSCTVDDAYLRTPNTERSSTVKIILDRLVVIHKYIVKERLAVTVMVMGGDTQTPGRGLEGRIKQGKNLTCAILDIQ